MTAVQTPIATLVNPLPPANRSAPRLLPASPLASAGSAAGEPKRAGAAGPSSADVALTDWSALMSAVKGRLERLAGEPNADDRPTPGSLLRMAEGVRQCVAALDQLHWRFGHVAASRTGILDAFFHAFARHQATHGPKPFLDWLRDDYDEAGLRAAFTSRPWADRLVDGVLRRE